jgi:DNA-binding NtrC family response regulator
LENHLDILIVHDDPVEALRLVRELARQGVPCECRCVQGKQAFLQALDQRQPGLILLDCCHSSPGFSGFAALDLAQERCPGVPFVSVTGSCEPGFLVELFASGAAGFVCRCRLNELGSAIEQALHEHSQHTEHSGEPRTPHLGWWGKTG